MKRFGRNTRARSAERRTDTVAELERLVRRIMAVPLIAPLLLVGGLAVGHLTTQALAIPDGVGRRIREGAGVPRGVLERLGQKMESARTDGVRTAEYIMMYRDHVAPIHRALRRHGVPDTTAKRVAWPLVEHAYRRGLDPATVLAVLLVESSGRPHVTSSVGARGLMQVMPFWVGHWRECGRDLYDIEDNLCHGTSILASYLERYNGDERDALLAYNGCTRDAAMRRCGRYPDRVQRIRRRIRAEWRAHRDTATGP